MTPEECLLKANNYAAAASLDPDNPRAGFWLELVEVWRNRAFDAYLGRPMIDQSFHLRMRLMETVAASARRSPAAARCGSQAPLQAHDARECQRAVALNALPIDACAT